MTGIPLAHSARPKRGIPAQRFWEHVERVTDAAARNAGRAADFWNGPAEAFCAQVRMAARFHDCGKLAPENQDVLAHSASKGLPVRHEDAGIAWLLEKGWDKAALLIASHHAGLPSRSAERAKPLLKPPGQPYRINEAIGHTAQHLADYILEYERAGLAEVPAAVSSGRWSGLAHRVALSCLVDADHGDTARHYGEALPLKAAECRWVERAVALDSYVQKLSSKYSEDPRNNDRRHVYEQCRVADPEVDIVCCDATVGSGKTTAVMAYLLRIAQKKGLRHIFVVLPYTNIIRQSVEVYRKALVLHGESPSQVVAEVHHRAEFENPESRAMSVLWDAPITVTTAVQFFETLAGNRPAAIRKLHELAGSAVFIDEAHAAIPIWLWPQTWLWVKELAKDWGCHFVLASGSLARFWTNPDIVADLEEVPDLLTTELRAHLTEAEKRRIEIRTEVEPMNCEELMQFVVGKAGPRLVILNTVQSAAVLADGMRKRGCDVLHLSTALAPRDRERILQIIEERLKDRSCCDWTLVATSCVEAGVDFSFRSAIRERCSVASLIQTSGRVNRHAGWNCAEVWDVVLQDPMFNRHPAFDASRDVLREMLENDEIGNDPSAAVTEALRRELVRNDVSPNAAALRKEEARGEFPRVAELYKVIDADTRTVVVDRDLLARLETRERIPWQDLLRGSVQMWARKVREWSVRTVDHHEELYCWTGPYDPDFLGYMEGVLPLIAGKDSGLYG